MLSKKLPLALVLLLIVNAYTGKAQKPNYEKKWEIKNPFTHNVFIENKGQFPEALEEAVKQPVLYYSVKGSMYVFFSQNTLTFLNSKFQKKENDGDKDGDADKKLISTPELMSI